MIRDDNTGEFPEDDLVEETMSLDEFDALPRAILDRPKQGFVGPIVVVWFDAQWDGVGADEFARYMEKRQEQDRCEAQDELLRMCEKS